MSKQTVNTVSKFIDSCDNNSIYEINIEGTDVKIKRNLSLEERAKFVTLAATSCLSRCECWEETDHEYQFFQWTSI